MVRQYVGARYVPKLADPVAWASGTSYEAMTIVTYNNSSYTSKVPVPATVGNPADNPDYWALTGNYNAQVEQYRQETETVSNNLTTLQGQITTEITNRENADTTLQGQITTEITSRKATDAALQNTIETEAKARQTANNILQGNINSEAATRASADSNLQSQINQIVAPSGEAPSAAEVQNARIGAYGVTYDTLGTAIRTQVNDIYEFYNPVSDLDNRDVDLFISDSYGNVLATFKDGEFRTKEFNTAESEKQHYSTFSILGDSYSTFNGYTEPLNNLQWYPPSDSATQGSENDVENVENTWWYLFANEYKSLLIQNNSYSGSCISYDSYGDGTIDGKNYSFVKRCENLKKAELIIIEGGTNDAWANVALGEYKYSNWVESDFETFRPACSYVLDCIKRNNIGAKIIFILNDGLKSSITESIKDICNHYNVDVLELSNIKKSNNHPNIEGMKQIKEQLINFLLRR